MTVRIGGVATTGTLVAALLVPLAAGASARPAMAASTESPTCLTASPPSAAGGVLALPPWSDGGGWSNPQMFETIISGDVDGDGWGELMAANGSTMDVWTWAKGYNAYQHSYTPTPGQWTSVVTYDNPAPFEANVYWDPSRYSVFQLADVDGVAGDELVARDGSGIQVYRWNSANQAFDPTTVITGPAWSDSVGWGPSNPDTYSTISTGDVDGDGLADVVGRGANGIEAWGYKGGTSLVRLDTPTGLLSDAEGWNAPQFYETIQLANIDDDAADELIGRGDTGIQAYDLTGGAWSGKAATTLPFPNSDPATSTDWTQPDKYGSIAVADLQPGGSGELMARSRTGLEAWTYDGSDWQLVARQADGDPDAPADGLGWQPPEYSSTVQPGDVLGGPGDEVIARGAYGVVAWAVQDGAWVQQPGTIGAFADGYYGPSGDPTVATDYRYGTIQPVTVVAGQQQMVIGRNVTGIETHSFTAPTVSAPFAPYTNLVGTPEGLPQLTGPTDLSGLTDEGRAFWYIDAQSAQQYGDITTEFWPATIETVNGPVTPQRPTIVDHYRDASKPVSGLAAYIAGLNPNDHTLLVDNPGVALNVSRDTFNAVRNDVAGWTIAVDQMRSLLGIGDGQLGVKQLLDQGFVQNATTQVENIKASFETNTPKWKAWLSNLIWGLVGGIGSFSVFLKEGKKLTAATVKGISFALQFGSSVGGAGAAIGINSIGGQNPNGALDTTADELDDTLINTFCASESFIDYSHDQIVQDWGMLTSFRQLTDSAGYDASLFDDALTHMTNSQDLWIWQQFANRPSGSNVNNWWVGTCDGGNSCSHWKQTDPGVWVSPEDPKVSYRLVHSSDNGSKPNCGTSVAGHDPAFVSLDSDPGDWSAPRKLDGSHLGMPLGTHEATIADNIGVNGWQLGTGACD